VSRLKKRFRQPTFWFGRIKRFKKSGAYLYLPARFVDSDLFPFEDDDVVKIELKQSSPKILKVSEPHWWEMLDWRKMPDAFERLPVRMRSQIKKARLIQ